MGLKSVLPTEALFEVSSVATKNRFESKSKQSAKTSVIRRIEIFNQ